MAKHIHIFAGFAFFLFLASSAYAQNTDAVLGVWLVEDKTGKIEIFKCGSKYCGKTVWIKPSADNPNPSLLTDTKNPDPAKRNQKLMGKTIMWGLTYNEKDKRWDNGSIYDSRSGKVYSCHITAEGSNKLLLRGFLGISLLGQTTVWTRR